MPPIALTIAGSDPSGGAGIQADLKTFHHFGVYGQAAITLLTVQNTQSVSRVDVMDARLVREQIDAVASDIPPAAVKTGALGSAEIVAAVAAWARGYKPVLVVDPVMLSKHGASLISEAAQLILRRELLPQAALITPNLPEAEALAGMRIQDESDMLRAAQVLLRLGCGGVLIKGGHADRATNKLSVDLFLDSDGPLRLAAPWIETRHTHGTGCTLSAAVTALLASQIEMREAVTRAKAFVQRAIESAPGLGSPSGHGPVNHFARI